MWKWIRFFCAGLAAVSAIAEQDRAASVLNKALHFADLYNWTEAAPFFKEAQQLFNARGDKRNALYAKLGTIRANVERERRPLIAISAEIGRELNSNALLRADKELRMFALIVKGDIDGEADTEAMSRDWEEVQALATDLRDQKWQNRSLAQLGVVAFYEGNLEKARKNIGTALATASKTGDVGAQIRFITIAANGLLQARSYEQALAYIESALAIARKHPDAGYQFTAQELRFTCLLAVRKIEAAQTLAKEIIEQARKEGRLVHEATTLTLSAGIPAAINDLGTLVATLQDANRIAESAGAIRILARSQKMLSDAYRKSGAFAHAERSATLAATAAQASGDLWAVPEILQTVADLQTAKGRFTDADNTYTRAEALIDTMMAKVTSVAGRSGLLQASSRIYSQHFSLVAEHLKNPAKALAIVEQVRGRTIVDLLRSGPATSPQGRRAEQVVSELRLKLMDAKSTSEVQRIRDQIFLAEQARWVSPGVSVLKANAHSAVRIEQLQKVLGASQVILEFVVTNPSSYCLVITRTSARIVSLGSKEEIEPVIDKYVQSVLKRQPAEAEARQLHQMLIGPIHEAEQKQEWIIVRDAKLHYLPFDALITPAGRYPVESKLVSYTPSATTWFLSASRQPQQRRSANSLLAVGDIAYGKGAVNRVGALQGYNSSKFADLPSSGEEVTAAQGAIRNKANKILVGAAATERAFKESGLAQYGTIHMAVHGVSNSVHPDRAALILLTDAATGEDGFLQTSEIAQLKLNANLVVLSACDSGIGSLQGQEGIANLSRAFLLAGAKAVVSTLWTVDDTSSSYLIRKFYAHFASGESAVAALARAKRDMLQAFGRKAVPFYWAGFTIEGAANQKLETTH